MTNPTQQEKIEIDKRLDKIFGIHRQIAGMSVLKLIDVKQAKKETRQLIIELQEGLIGEELFPYSKDNQPNFVEPIIAKSINTPLTVEPWVNKGWNAHRKHVLEAINQLKGEK